MRVLVTGDIHGNPERLQFIHSKEKLTTDDVIVVLGDVGANYYLSKRDIRMKDVMNGLGCTIFCIHGNHEARPQTIRTYKERLWHGGRVLHEEAFPNILFPVDGDIFDLIGNRCIVIGGAYSVDKYYRLARGYAWFPDEQPTEDVKRYVEEQLKVNAIDVVFSHTCPEKYTPIEMFLPGIDQSTVDSSMEQWLDGLEDNLQYTAWCCGHWHTDKRVDRMHFLYQCFVELDAKGKEKVNVTI